MARRTPKYEEIIDGVRVRVYATRTGLETLVGDANFDDDDAPVWIFPKFIGCPAAASQAVLNYLMDRA